MVQTARLVVTLVMTSFSWTVRGSARTIRRVDRSVLGAPLARA
jgi:hypothetical protein